MASASVSPIRLAPLARPIMAGCPLPGQASPLTCLHTSRDGYLDDCGWLAAAPPTAVR